MMYSMFKSYEQCLRYYSLNKSAPNQCSLTLIQTHFLDFLEIACCYWPDLTIIQDNRLGLGRINLNSRQACGFQKNSSFSNSLTVQA